MRERKLYLVLLVLICYMEFIRSGQGDDLGSRKPQIDTLNTTIILEKGENLSLTCSSNKEVKWDSTALGPMSRVEEPDGHSVLFLDGGHIQGSYYILLNITYAQYYDTGRYTCLYLDGARTLNSSVYIYVKDPDHLLLGHDTTPFPIIRLINKNRPAIIPCKVSDPAINVSLVKSIGQIDVSEKEDITYDPEVGFTLLFPNVFYAGNFKCLATQNGSTDEMMVLLRYNAQFDPNIMPPIAIDVSPSNSLLVGSSLKLTCKIKVEKETLVLITWSYPNKDNPNKIKLSRTERQKVRGEQYFYYELSNTLEIDSVDKLDNGVYRCTISDYQRSSFGETVIYVYDKTFVYLTPGEDVKVVLGDKKAFLYYEINAFPRPTLEWYSNNLKISNSYIYKMGQTEDAAALTIFSPSYKDMGNYTLKAFTDDMNASSSMELIVLGPPKVRWMSKKPPETYLAGRTFKLDCGATGYPEANITWLFSECTPDNCSEWQNLTDTDLRYTVTGQHQESQLEMVAKTTGKIQCFAENSFGSSSVETQFTIVEVKNGLGFGDLKRNFTEHDRLELVCYGSLFFFQSLTIYKIGDPPISLVSHNDSSDDDYPSTDDVEYRVNNSGTPNYPFQIVIESTRYSIVRKAVFESLTKQDAGVYKCLGLTFDGDFKSEEFNLKLHKIIGPTFVKITSGGIRAMMFSSLTMECFVDGFPLPKVRWYKDGSLIRNNNTMSIGFTHTGFRMMIENATEVHVGNYVCEASNYGGTIYSRNMTLFVGEQVAGAAFPKVYIGIIVGILIATSIIIIIIIIFVKRMRKRLVIKMKDYEQYLLVPKGDYNPEIPIDEQTASLPYDPKWEFPKDRLRLGNVLGQGAFGRVIKTEAIGILDGQYVTTVAVKMVKDCTDKEQMMALLSELKILIHIGQHLNILNLLGAVTKNIRFGELYVIVEYCHFGNVRTYLLKNKDNFIDTMEDYIDPATEKKREAAAEKVKHNYVNKPAANNSADLIGPPLTTKNLICWAFQASRGMEYLASKKYIHRDLAARNVLLSEDNVVKISDFGLAKDCYKNMEYKKKGDGPVPVKWMALESLTHKLYTTKSDVWSYGVFLYELFSLGGNPYSGIELNEKFIGLLKSGYRMEKPKHASDDIYNIMLRCWEAVPDKRPSFIDLVNIMGDFLEANVKQYYLDLNSPYAKMPDECGADAKQDGYLKMSGSADYTPMSVALTDPYMGEEEGESARYINQGRWRGEKAHPTELFPLTEVSTQDDDDGETRKPEKAEKEKRESNSPVQLRTRADIHFPEDTDSGHSSSYAPGTSPVDNNGYLVPKILEEPEKNCSPKPNSLFHSVFNESPPDYRAVMEENPNSRSMC